MGPVIDSGLVWEKADWLRPVHGPELREMAAGSVAVPFFNRDGPDKGDSHRRWKPFLAKHAASDGASPLSPRSQFEVSSKGRLFHDGDFLVAQAVQLVDQLVDLPVGGGDLPLKHRLVVLRPRRRKLLVQGQHRLH